LRLLVTSFLCLCFFILPVAAEELKPDIQKMARDLDDKNLDLEQKFPQFEILISNKDSIDAFAFLDELALAGKDKGKYFQARFNCLKAIIIYLKNYKYILPEKHGKPAKADSVKQQVYELFSPAMDLAYKTEDDYLIAFVNMNYARVYRMLGELGTAMIYAKSATDIYEKNSYNVNPHNYQFVAEMMYKVREYDECIRYGLKAVHEWQISPNQNKILTLNCINTGALAYHRLQNHDSASYYYKQALQLAKKHEDTVWAGIVSGNMGQVYFAIQQYDSAYSLLMQDYTISKKFGYYNNAANSLQWAARTNLARSNISTALFEVNEAMDLLKIWPDSNYLKNTYYTKALILRQMGEYDSAFHYNDLYSALNHSLEKEIATNSLDISRAKLDNEINRYNIQNLKNQKQAGLLLRNLIIVFILVISMFILLILNSKRLKEKLQKGIVEREKLLMEQEIRSAKEQLSMFTNNMIEKANLIKKLEMEVKHTEDNYERQSIISVLSNQTILTDEDWNNFKSYFVKIHPGFLMKLREDFPGITLAERRMAALIRLRLTTKQMASMLGISIDSVHKTKQRLKQRLQVPSDTSLDEIVMAIK